jgi:hypothetical protein
MSPSIILSLVIATCYGCGFHAVFGRRLWQWPVFWLAAIAGFFLGYVLGVAVGLELGRVGSVPLVAATLGAAALLALAWFFSAPWATDGGDGP